MKSHGANLFELSREYNFKKDEILDFSSNVNPLGPSKLALEYLKENLNLVTTYPDPNYVDLKKSISCYVKVDSEDLVLGCGTTELLSGVIEAINPKKALLLAPCYSEYEEEINKIKSNIIYYNLKEKDDFKIDVNKIISIIDREDIELFVMANPNNPTGTILNSLEIKKILDSTNSYVLVDETYNEFTKKDFSSIGLYDEYEKLFIARGVSKFFASPGIRLGYGITKSKRLKEYFKNKNLIWNINIFAELMGSKMFEDSLYQKKVYEFIKKEREYVYNSLKDEKNLKIFKSYGNFILFKILNNTSAKELRDELLKNKMIIRDCSSFENLNDKFFRICILNKEDNKKLVSAIREFLWTKNY